MKLAKHNNSLKTNMNQTETQNFGIGDASVVIEILRNRLYKHPIRTLVQEYISNGRDASREVNSKKPIEITVPNRLNPVFKVRDFGPGISPERVKTVFVLYGASTKRDTNSQTGGFGIGAKSAWSYTDSFTIRTIVDGTERVYLAHTGVNNNGRLDLLSETKTKEPCGTEIQIAVKPENLRDFKRAIFRTVYFWPKESYSIKGLVETELMANHVEGHKPCDELEVVAPNILPDYIQTGWRTDPIAVIDGIPYVLNETEALNQLNKYLNGQIILHIPNGLVEISASRESIADSDTTKEALKELTKRCMSKIDKLIKNEFKKVKTIKNFAQFHDELGEKFYLSKFGTFKNYEITRNNLYSDDLKKVNIMNCYYHNKKLYKDKAERNQISYSIQLDRMNCVFFDDGTESALKLNKRIRYYLDQGNARITIISKKDQLNSDGTWVDAQKNLDKIIKDLELESVQVQPYVEPPKVPKAKRVKAAKEFCLHSYERYSREYVHTTLKDNTKKWAYVLVDDLRINKHKDFANHLGYTLCAVSKTTLNIIKDDANFTCIQKLIKDYKITQDDINLILRSEAMNQSSIESLEQLKGIKDPVLTNVMKFYKNLFKNDDGRRNYDASIILDKVKETTQYAAFEKMDVLFQDRLNQYTLFQSYLNKEEQADMVLYMNHKFETKLK